MKRTSLTKLSAELNLSTGTVSEILNKKSKKYKAETIKRVFQAATRHNYLPSAAANMMLKKKYNSIALATSFPERRGTVDDNLVRGVQAELTKHGYHLVFAPISIEKLTDENYMPEFLKTWMVDGILVLYWHDVPERFEELITKYEIPAIWLNCKREHDCVYGDEFSAVEKVTKNLLKDGIRNIVYADYNHADLPGREGLHFSGKDRWMGYENAMKSAGLKPFRFGSLGYVMPEDRMGDAGACFKKQSCPDAIIAYHQDTALPIYCAALNAGIEVPEKLSIITFAEAPGAFPIKILLLPWQELGQRGTKLLLDKINHPEAKPFDPLVLEINENKLNFHEWYHKSLID